MAKAADAPPSAATDVLVLGEHPATYIAAALLAQQSGKSGKPLRVIHVQIPDERLPSGQRHVLVNPKFFDLHDVLEGLRRKLSMTPVYGIRFLADDPPTASEHKTRSAVAYVATYQDVRAASIKLAEAQGVEMLAPVALHIHVLDEKGAQINVDKRQLRPKVLLLGGKLSESQQKMLGLPDAWEREIVHRYTFLRLKGSSSAASTDLGPRPTMPMSLDLRGKLCWAWMFPPHDGQLQLAVAQPIETVAQMPAKDLLKHWASVLRRHGVLKSDGELPIDSAAESVDLPFAGALAHEDVANRTLLIGPAGGFYAATGEDIYPNCWSAVFAAEILKKALRETHLQDALQSYRHKWRTTLGDYLRGPQQNLRFLLPLVYRNQRMTDRFAEAILSGKSVVR